MTFPNMLVEFAVFSSFIFINRIASNTIFSSCICVCFRKQGKHNNKRKHSHYKIIMFEELTEICKMCFSHMVTFLKIGVCCKYLNSEDIISCFLYTSLSIALKINPHGSVKMIGLSQACLLFGCSFCY